MLQVLPPPKPQPRGSIRVLPDGLAGVSAWALPEAAPAQEGPFTDRRGGRAGPPSMEGGAGHVGCERVGQPWCGFGLWVLVMWGPGACKGHGPTTWGVCPEAGQRW